MDPTSSFSLPIEVWDHIGSFLPHQDRFALSNANKELNLIFNANNLRDLRKIPCTLNLPYTTRKVEHLIETSGIFNSEGLIEEEKEFAIPVILERVKKIIVKGVKNYVNTFLRAYQVVTSKNKTYATLSKEINTKFYSQLLKAITSENNLLDKAQFIRDYVSYVKHNLSSPQLKPLLNQFYQALLVEAITHHELFMKTTQSREHTPHKSLDWVELIVQANLNCLAPTNIQKIFNQRLLRSNFYSRTSSPTKNVHHYKDQAIKEILFMVLLYSEQSEQNKPEEHYRDLLQFAASTGSINAFKQTIAFVETAIPNLDIRKMITHTRSRILQHAIRTGCTDLIAHILVYYSEAKMQVMRSNLDLTSLQLQSHLHQNFNQIYEKLEKYNQQIAHVLSKENPNKKPTRPISLTGDALERRILALEKMKEAHSIKEHTAGDESLMEIANDREEMEDSL